MFIFLLGWKGLTNWQGNKSYQVTPFESLDTAALRPGTYRMTRVVDGCEW